MGNLISALIGSVMMLYLKITSKFSRKGEALLNSDNNAKDQKNDSKEKKQSTHNNEYQLIKNTDDFEIKSDNTEAIEEISKEIKNVNINVTSDKNLRDQLFEMSPMVERQSSKMFTVKDKVLPFQMHGMSLSNKDLNFEESMIV